MAGAQGFPLTFGAGMRMPEASPPIQQGGMAAEASTSGPKTSANSISPPVQDSEDDHTICSACMIWSEPCQPATETNRACRACASKGKFCDLSYFNEKGEQIKPIPPAIVGVRKMAVGLHRSIAENSLKIPGFERMGSQSMPGFQMPSMFPNMGDPVYDRLPKRAKYEYPSFFQGGSQHPTYLPTVQEFMEEDVNRDFNSGDVNTVQCIEELEENLVANIEEHEASIESHQRQVARLKKELDAIRRVKRDLEKIRDEFQVAPLHVA